MTIAAQLAQNTKLYIEGSAASAEVITAITLGFPTIIAITGHAGVANGDSVTLAGFEGADAATLNALSFVVTHYATGATNDTFAIEVNTVGKTITVGSGTTTATPTAWIQVKGLKTIKPAGVSLNTVDATDLDSTVKQSLFGLSDPESFTCDVNIIDTDPGQIAVAAAKGVYKDYKTVTSQGVTRTFSAACKKWPIMPDTTIDGIQTGSAEWVLDGGVTVS